ncbi:MAG: carboxypeptidase-like regulatory domain-containing protein [Patulibacter minatonensis]
MPVLDARPRCLRRVLLVALALLASVALAPAAHAGTYTVWSCKTPAGQPTTTDGWTGSSNMSYNSPQDSCASGGDLYVNFGGPDQAFNGGQGVRFVFNAPADTRILDVTANRQWIVTRNGAGDSQGGAGIGIYRNAMVYDGPYVVEQCQSFNEPQCYITDGTIRFDVNGGLVGFDTGCYGPGYATCSGSQQYGRSGQSWRWAKLRMADDLGPSISAAVGGTITDDRAVSGRETLSIPLADRGSGLWQAEVKVGDTVVVPRSTLDANGGRCAEVNVDAAVPNEFGTPTPCKLALTAAWTIDTTTVPEGEQLAQATVWDAANNATVVWQKRVLVRQPEGPAPSLTLTKAKATVAYKGRVAVTGRLVDAGGAPIANASIDVVSQVAYAGAPEKRGAKVTTDASGTFSYSPSPRASGTLRFEYTRPGRSAPAASATFALKVRGKLDFAASRTRLRHGSVARFAGKVRNGPLGKGTKVLIEVQLRGKWRLAATVKAKQTGSFSWSRRLTAVTTYRFRARLQRSSDLPAEPAVSRTVAVRLT